jgi:hypothetical protein
MVEINFINKLNNENEATQCNLKQFIMKSERRFLAMPTGTTNGKLSAFKIAQDKARKSPKKLLKKVDVFAEPFSEIFNEFIDIIAISFDKVKEAVFGSNEQNRGKTVETGMKVKTTPGRYARVKD